MKKYTTPSVEEIKVVSMEHITQGSAGGSGSGYGGTGRPGA